MKIKLLSAILLCATTHAYASCGSSFCAVNTHWDAQELVNDDGLRIDLRYSYTRADRLRYGSSRIAPALPAASDAEIENMRTINQLLNVDFDYAINDKWNVAVGLPVVIRDHAHTFDSSISGPFAQQAKFTDLGDIRVVGNYKFDSDDHLSGSGMRFGLKLPTGVINKTMTPPDPADPATPYALERSAQPDTGSTDVILGAYYHQGFANSPWGWFISGQLQTAMSTRDNYRPGTEITFDLGTRYALSSSITGLLQLNAQFKEHDGGAFANPASGAHNLNLSPGLSAAVAPKTRLYGFVQLPLYQYANGDPADPLGGQLTAPWSVSFGLSQTF